MKKYFLSLFILLILSGCGNNVMNENKVISTPKLNANIDCEARGTEYFQKEFKYGFSLKINTYSKTLDTCVIVIEDTGSSFSGGIYDVLADTMIWGYDYEIKNGKNIKLCADDDTKCINKEEYDKKLIKILSD